MRVCVYFSFFCIIVWESGWKSQKDMTIINTRMFGITFEVSLASFKLFTFMNKPLFIHTSEKI